MLFDSDYRKEIDALIADTTIADRIELERIIVTAIVDDAFFCGYLISIDDGDGEWMVVRSKARMLILDTLLSCDEEQVHFHTDRGQRVGWVFLVYGNDGYDVICDYTDTPDMHLLLERAQRIADFAEQSDEHAALIRYVHA